MSLTLTRPSPTGPTSARPAHLRLQQDLGSEEPIVRAARDVEDAETALRSFLEEQFGRSRVYDVLASGRWTRDDDCLFRSTEAREQYHALSASFRSRQESLQAAVFATIVEDLGSSRRAAEAIHIASRLPTRFRARKDLQRWGIKLKRTRAQRSTLLARFVPDVAGNCCTILRLFSNEMATVDYSPSLTAQQAIRGALQQWRLDEIDLRASNSNLFIGSLRIDPEVALSSLRILPGTVLALDVGAPVAAVECANSVASDGSPEDSGDEPESVDDAVQ